MPISGSYYFPQVTSPNSSYPSVVMREVSSSLVPAGSNVGKLFVSNNNELTYVDENGVESKLVTPGGGSIISGNLLVSGSIEVLGQIFDGNSDLILSSAVGSVIAASGNLEFPIDASPDSAHIIATNSDLILSSSTGDVVSSGTFVIPGGLVTEPGLLLGPTKTHGVYWGGNWRFVASGGSIAGFTANEFFFFKDIQMASAGTGRIYNSGRAVELGLNATTSHGLLSGDVIVGRSLEVDGETFFDAPVTISGTLSAVSGSQITLSNNLSTRTSTISHDSNATWETSNGGISLKPAGSERFLIPAGSSVAYISPLSNIFAIRQDGGTAGVDELQLSHDGESAKVNSLSGDLILSSSVGSQVTISGNLGVLGSASFADGTTAIPGINFISAPGMGFKPNGPTILEFMVQGNRKALLSATAFSVKDGLDIFTAGAGKFINSAAHVTLSSSAGSQVTISGNLATTQQAYSQLSTTLRPSGSNPTQAVDWNNGNSQILMLNSASLALTASFSNPQAGASYILKIIQHDVSAIDIAWPANVLYPGGTAPVISTGAGAEDVASLFYDGTNYYFSIGQDYA